MTARARAERPGAHAAVTLDAVINAIEERDHPGLCVACGAETDGVELDAAEYPEVQSRKSYGTHH